MRVSSLNTLAPGDVVLGVVYASVKGVNENSYDECWSISCTRPRRSAPRR